MVTATFDPAVTAPDQRTNTGATWGFLAASSDDPDTIGGARDLLLYGRLDREYVPRVQLAATILLILSVVSIAAIARLMGPHQATRQTLTGLWLASPVILYILLNG